MTRLISLSKQSKELLRKILRSVFFEYNYVNISKKGYITLRRGIFSRPEFLNLLDFTGEFAMRVALKAEQKGLGDFTAIKNNVIEEVSMMVKIYHYNRNYDIVEHLWRIYEKAYNSVDISASTGKTAIPLPESLAAKVHKVIDNGSDLTIKVVGSIQ